MRHLSTIAARTTLVLASFVCLLSPSHAAQNIQFWTLGLKPKFTPYFENLVKQYEAQNAGVKIIWTDYPFEIMQTKLASSIGSGKPPSLVNLSVPMAEEFSRHGMLQAVDSVIGDTSIYHKQALEDLRFQGKLYGFPHYNNINVLAYNRTLFQQAGVKSAPKSLDEILQTATQIASKTGQAGFAPPLGKIDNYFLQQGLPLLKGGRAAFNSPQHIALLNKFQQAYAAKALLKDGLFAENNFPAVISAYNGKRLAMMVGATTVLKRVQLDAPLVFADTEIAAAPVGPTGIADGGWLFHFAIPNGVPAGELPEVGKFARYLTNDANQLAFAKLAGVFPSTQKAASAPSFTTLAANANAADKAIAVAASSINNARTLYVAGIPDYQQLQRILVNATEAAVTGKKPAKQALDEAASAWNKQLDKNLAKQLGNSSAKK